MSLKLTTMQCQDIYDTVKQSFSDFPLFDSLVSEKLKLFLNESNNLEINEKFTKRIVGRYYSMDAFKKPEQKALLYPLELIFQCACVLAVSHQETTRNLVWKDKKEFLNHYPQFKKGIDETEIGLLLNFRNMMKIALTIIPAKLNKGRLLQISGKLEGSQGDYITGSGQKVEVDRRVEIYQQEGKQKAAIKHGRSRVRVLSTDSDSDTEDDEDDERALERNAKKRRRVRNAYKRSHNKIKRPPVGCAITCTSSSFSNTKLKMMVMNDVMVQELLDQPIDSSTLYKRSRGNSYTYSSVDAKKPQDKKVAIVSEASSEDSNLSRPSPSIGAQRYALREIKKEVAEKEHDPYDEPTTLKKRKYGKVGIKKTNLNTVLFPVDSASPNLSLKPTSPAVDTALHHSTWNLGQHDSLMSLHFFEDLLDFSDGVGAEDRQSTLTVDHLLREVDADTSRNEEDTADERSVTSVENGDENEFQNLFNESSQRHSLCVKSGPDCEDYHHDWDGGLPNFSPRQSSNGAQETFWGEGCEGSIVLVPSDSNGVMPAEQRRESSDSMNEYQNLLNFV